MPLHILIVDDDPVMSELLSALLSLEGHVTLTADSGENALKVASAAIQSAPLDVILTDMQLPGLQGAALAAQLRPMLVPGGRLIGMSGSEPSTADREACDAFLLKPFTVNEFTAAVSSSQPQARRPQPETSLPESTPSLDDSIFARMKAQLPAPQLQQLYTLTVDDARARLTRMSASEAAGDHDAVRREAHAIKGGAGMVGATELHLLAGRLEAGSPGDTPALADLIAACDRLRRMLDARFSL